MRSLTCLPSAAFAVLLAGCATAGTDRPAPQGASAEIAAPAGQIVIAGQRVFPESIASSRLGFLYVGSNPGTIYRAAAGSDVATAWIEPDSANGLGSVFGVLADDDRGLLWVCSNPAMGSEGGAPGIKAFDLANGALVRSYPLTVNGPAMCNDMTIARDGAVFASEILGGRILRLEPGGQSFEVWAVDPEFATLDGISFAADGTLYANAIQRGTLLRIHRASDGSFARAEVVASGLDTPDGLRPLPDGRMLQSEGNAGLITVIAFAPDGSAVVTPIAEGIDYASSVTPMGGRAYYPDGKLRYLFGPDAGKDPGEFVIRSVAIPEAE